MKLLSELAAVFSAFSAQGPLALGWLLYASFHSLSASTACKDFVRRRWPGFFARDGKPDVAPYRRLFSALAALLLLPLLALSIHTPGPQLWAWTGAQAWLANGFAALALLSFLRGGSGYDVLAFLGLRPAATFDTPRLVITHWHRFVRHPWYSLALVLIWTRDMSASSFVSASLITLYFIIGSRLEEDKLVAVFGERYRAYRRQVPGLLPLPWRVLTKEEARRLAG